jgi:hypothetical protein
VLQALSGRTRRQLSSLAIGRCYLAEEIRLRFGPGVLLTRDSIGGGAPFPYHATVPRSLLVTARPTPPASPARPLSQVRSPC